MSDLDEQHMQAWNERNFARAMDSVKERAEKAHAKEVEGVCSSCGGRTVNAQCLANCDGGK